MSSNSDMRSQMINAAIEMMEVAGEASVRVAKVAEKVGVTEPLVYHHFKNRAALVTAAYAEWYKRCQDLEVPIDQLMAMVTNQEEYERAVRASLTWSYQPERVAARGVRLSVIGAAQTDPELATAVNEINRRFLTSLAQATEYAQSQGWVRKDLDPMATAYWLHGQINGRVIAEMDNGCLDLAKWDEVSFDAIFSLIRPRK
ncbi:MAG: TetR/AcrR family transcriptional regulator [Ilumatobacteraceae bacterium]|jgi:AcrR family transcriptional regulator|nr:TetR/AcrR family transcriptional regulator [Ilumatobacteraceae bacterium]